MVGTCRLIFPLGNQVWLLASPFHMITGPVQRIMSYFHTSAIHSNLQTFRKTWLCTLFPLPYYFLVLNSCIERHWNEDWEWLLDWVIYSGNFCGQALFLWPFWDCSPVHRNTALCNTCAIAADVAALLDTVLGRDFNFNLHPTLGKYLVLVLLSIFWKCVIMSVLF